MSATVTVDGLDAPIVSSQRFTTTVKNIEKAEAKGERVQFQTEEGRVAVHPTKILLVKEIKGSETEEEQKGAKEEPAAVGGPFGKGD